MSEAVAEALFYAARRDDWGVANDDERQEFLDMAAAVEPLIRAQAFADAAAVFRRTRDQWVAERGTPDHSPRAEYAYGEGWRVLSWWAKHPEVIDKTLEKIAAATETEKP